MRVSSRLIAPLPSMSNTIKRARSKREDGSSPVRVRGRGRVRVRVRARSKREDLLELELKLGRDQRGRTAPRLLGLEVEVEVALGLELGRDQRGRTC